MPPPEDLGSGHIVHCFRHQEVAKLDRAADTFAEFQQEAERVLGKPPVALSM
jgi:oligopeptide transport system ATP-binding protein